MASGKSSSQQTKFDAKIKAMFETEDEKFQKLLNCLEPLRQNNVRMVKHVRVLTTIPYKEVRDSVLAKANSLGICPLSHEMNLRHIYEVCQWMKTKAGTEAVVEVQRTEKLKRHAMAKGRSGAESAMIRAFNAQFAEYSSELKKERKEDVKCALYKYVEGLIERKMVSFAVREAETLRVVLKEMECFEVTVSSKGGDCCVGKKRKDIGSVLGHGGEASSKSKKRSTRTKKI
ncbi:hypothetical protein AALP_AA4G070300 [Arabis alpina]|uniref:Uncharacterized protein n=1 Tax=Arabis alpina TaxID=50452 RepID=A0A087H1N9_ARAAL|nr:hypothetical protein AALP_AA4G070300 [Arabis alpina]